MICTYFWKTVRQSMIHDYQPRRAQETWASAPFRHKTFCDLSSVLAQCHEYTYSYRLHPKHETKKKKKNWTAALRYPYNDKNNQFPWLYKLITNLSYNWLQKIKDIVFKVVNIKPTNGLLFQQLARWSVAVSFPNHNSLDENIVHVNLLQ